MSREYTVSKYPVYSNAYRSWLSFTYYFIYIGEICLPVTVCILGAATTNRHARSWPTYNPDFAGVTCVIHSQCACLLLAPRDTAHSPFESGTASRHKKYKCHTTLARVKQQTRGIILKDPWAFQVRYRRRLFVSDEDRAAVTRLHLIIRMSHTTRMRAFDFLTSESEYLHQLISAVCFFILQVYINIIWDYCFLTTRVYSLYRWTVSCTFTKLVQLSSESSS